MDFSWNSKKAKENLKKHKVSFEEAKTVFYNSSAKITYDPDHSKDEDRYILIGYSQSSLLLFVVHVYKESDEIIHIISARKATNHERKDFEEL